MPFINYISKKFNANSLQLIDTANEIIQEYQADAMKLTLRQLYYQFVSRDLIANTAAEYKRLGTIISQARLAGMIDWDAIEDRTRNLKINYHNTDPGDAVNDALDYYCLDKWKDQLYRPEIWIEKEALIGVIAGVCSELDVPYFACKGYTSQSEMWKAAMRMQHYETVDQTPVVFHLGDHDPSGIDMTRDIKDRLTVFMGGVEVKRIALTYAQIVEFSPPPNPAKLTDTRAHSYIEQFGALSWELDALEPRYIKKLIVDSVDSVTDHTVMKRTISKERKHKKILKKVVDNWENL